MLKYPTDISMTYANAKPQFVYILFAPMQRQSKHETLIVTVASDSTNFEIIERTTVAKELYHRV